MECDNCNSKLKMSVSFLLIRQTWSTWHDVTFKMESHKVLTGVHHDQDRKGAQGKRREGAKGMLDKSSGDTVR